ncbi:MAG: hypothetical protein J0H98_02190 [Solirubrobacterales bacterium]|nr:hypothetical protein [Solirubrobacterales bacterium]
MPNARNASNWTRKYAKYSVTAVLALLAVVVLLVDGQTETAKAAPASCPKFRVVHNDKIGNVSFPAGYYDVTLLNSSRLTCAQSTKLFQEFLQDWDGKLRSPWVLTQSGNKRTFSAGRGSDKGFTATPSNGGGGGGGGGSTGASCPGYFTVVRSDSIGSFYVPAGRYRISLLSSRLSCSKATNLFQEFLLDFDGKLPKPWRLSKASATFYKSTNPTVGFNINKAYDPAPNPDKNRRYARCAGTFQVLHNDRIGALNLPKGPYYIYVGNKTGLSCSAASDYFREFLNRTDGRLPKPWKLNAAKARFRAGPGGYVFRVQKA